MSYEFFQNNPCQRTTGDCSVRAVSCALDITWDAAYMKLVNEGYRICEMPSANATVGSLLRQNGFRKYSLIENENYTLRDFARQHAYGIYVVFTDGHVVTVIDGTYYDAWDSGDEIPDYFWEFKGDRDERTIS